MVSGDLRALRSVCRQCNAPVGCVGGKLRWREEGVDANDFLQTREGRNFESEECTQQILIVQMTAFHHPGGQVD